MKSSLQIKTVINGEVVDFAPDGIAIRSPKMTYTADRMGGTPKLTCTVAYTRPLDDEWTGKEFVEFHGERYYILDTPSSSKENTNLLYNHNISFVSERVALEHEYFYDAVVPTSVTPYEDGYHSNNDEFAFWGTANEYIQKLNRAIKYVGLDYIISIDNYSNPLPVDLLEKEREVSFSKKRLAEAIQEINSTYELPYYFVGKNIIVGYTENVIAKVFEYGKEGGLLSINRENSNTAIVNRITGKGSSDNIPYYYPNKSAKRGEAKDFIPYASNLMPSIYRESHGRERYYDAKNDTYLTPAGNGDKYEFVNPYSDDNPRADIQTFDDIKPSITNMVNASGEPMDCILDAAFDSDDNDDLIEGGDEYQHSYFYVKLPMYDGDYAFNLFEQALESEEAKICFTSGECASCEFEIGVTRKQIKDEDGENKYIFNNPVQADKNGNIADGNYNNKVKPSHLQSWQQDTSTNAVWIALKKDNTTRSIVMPNHTHYIVPKAGDKFVITGIKMPDSYIYAAEKKLEQELIKYMFENNVEKFNFTIKFSRIFLEENPDVAQVLNENARITIRYNKQDILLYVTNITIKTDDNILQEVSVTLKDEIAVANSSLTMKLNEAKTDILNSVAGYDMVARMNKYFLRKDVDDKSRATVGAKRFQSNQFETENFASGQVLGAGGSLYERDGKSYVETDYLIVRLKAMFAELEINKIRYTQGDIIAGHAGNTITSVVPVRYMSIDTSAYEVTDGTENAYLCHLKLTDGEKKAENCWVSGDQARCEVFNMEEVDGAKGNRFYWRKVINVGVDYVILSRYDCAEGSDIPREGDDIVQMGNAFDPERQDGIMLSINDVDAPCLKMYTGLDSYQFTPANLPIVISPKGSKFTGELIAQVNGTQVDVVDLVNSEYDKRISEFESKLEVRLNEINLSVKESLTGGNNLLFDSAFEQAGNIADKREFYPMEGMFSTIFTAESMVNGMQKDPDRLRKDENCVMFQGGSVPMGVQWLWKDKYMLENGTYRISFYARLEDGYYQFLKEHGNANSYIGIEFSTLRSGGITIQDALYSEIYVEGVSESEFSLGAITEEWARYTVTFEINLTDAQRMVAEEQVLSIFSNESVRFLLSEPILTKGEGNWEWRRGTADEKKAFVNVTSNGVDIAALRNGLEVAGVHVDGERSVVKVCADNFRIMNVDGEVTMSVDVDGNLTSIGNGCFSGKVVSGKIDGRRVQMDNASQSVSIHGDDGVEITRLEGNTRTKSQLVPTNTLTSFSYTGKQTVRQTTASTSAKTFTKVLAKASAYNGKTSVHVNVGELTIMAQQADVECAVYYRVYADAACTKLVWAYQLGSGAVRAIDTSFNYWVAGQPLPKVKTITIGGHDIDPDAGYHTIEMWVSYRTPHLKMFPPKPHPTAPDIEQMRIEYLCDVSCQVFSGQVTKSEQRYTNTMFGNGIALSYNQNNYYAALKEGNSINFHLATNGMFYSWENGVHKVNGAKQPVLAFYGLYWNGSNYLSQYTKMDNVTVTVTRVSAGTYSIKMVGLPISTSTNSGVNGYMVKVDTYNSTGTYAKVSGKAVDSFQVTTFAYSGNARTNADFIFEIYLVDPDMNMVSAQAAMIDDVPQAQAEPMAMSIDDTEQQYNGGDKTEV